MKLITNMEAWKLSQQQISNYRIDIDNNIIKKGKTAMATTMGECCHTSVHC